MRLRDAVAADAGAIAAIFNDAVRNTLAIWSEAEVSAANRADWIAARQGAGLPVLVAEDAQGAVQGYASYGEWRAFAGFRHTVEHSVYVAPAARGGGVGRLLMAALIDRARAQGKHVMVAGIEAGNLASIRLHESFGFRQTALMPEVGCKFGRWLDLAFLQLRLDDRLDPDAIPRA
ncbi:GNAT family N-acetyltransferase [Frigidibacter oleivorans]|uniref:GNAT family N-acetyltransferase n=1 Tax=Frigidibacter oleivorans TaxID=2487129 RepID=UPI000F8F0BDD|nr:GNAT family N-acetyltransferase [Frigidibacter oleivorans]